MAKNGEENVVLVWRFMRMKPVERRNRVNFRAANIFTTVGWIETNLNIFGTRFSEKMKFCLFDQLIHLT